MSAFLQKIKEVYWFYDGPNHVILIYKKTLKHQYENFRSSFFCHFYRNKFVATTVTASDANLFYSINDVIIEVAESGVNITDVLGIDRIELLDQMQHTFYFENTEIFESEVRESYETARNLIGYTMIDTNTWLLTFY